MTSMRQSKLFTKTRKADPSDEVTKNAKLLVRAGFVHKEMAGVYTYLPLGLRVLKKIENIVREEINAIDGIEILMSSMHPKENWEKTGRWASMDDLYKIKDASGREVALGATHEEIIAPIIKEFVSSYKDLPIYVYQIQNKFRMELRAKSGILRGREFIMKDLYSFHTNEDDLNKYYEKVLHAYKKIFKKVGLEDKTILTFASGGTFAKYSHEFQTLTSAGEDIIHICEKCNIAVNEEIIADQKVCPECDSGKLKKEKAVEVANIFKLKTKYSKPFELNYANENDESLPVIMGCYGMGLGRLLGTVVEVYYTDESGLVWPKDISPFDAHLIEINPKDNSDVKKESVAIYQEIDGVVKKDVLFDDRDLRPGEKFADADLIGIPLRIIVSEKTINENKYELHSRQFGKTEFVSKTELLERLSG